MSEARNAARRDRKNKARREQRQKLPVRDTAETERDFPATSTVHSRVGKSVVFVDGRSVAVRDAMTLAAAEALQAQLWVYGSEQCDLSSNDPGAHQLAIWQQNVIAVLDFLRDAGFPAAQQLALQNLLAALNNRSFGGDFARPNKAAGRPPISAVVWERRVALVALADRLRKGDTRSAEMALNVAAREAARRTRAAGAQASLFDVTPEQAEERLWVRAESIVSWRQEIAHLPRDSEDRKLLHELRNADEDELLALATCGLSELRGTEALAAKFQRDDETAPQVVFLGGAARA